jgi:hypothetical protein
VDQFRQLLIAMKKLLLSTACTAAVCIEAHAVTITLDCEVLKDASGSAMPISGIVVLTAATEGIFSGPTPTSFVSGTEILLQKWDLSAFATPGVFSDITDDLAFGGTWGTGDPLRMYWFPTLTLLSASPGAGTSYGTYVDPLGLLDGSAAWVTPAESDTIGLKFYTSDASFLSAGGANSADVGLASLTVAPIPEPGTAAVGVMALLAAMGITRRRQRTIASSTR